MSRYGLASWDEAVAALQSADEVVLACHVNPDGDAIGSLLGASLGLRKLGKKTFPTWAATPPAMPPGYSFMPGAADLVAPVDIPATKVFWALDCGAGDRLGTLEGAARRAETLINLDHHPGNDEFGTINVVVPTAASTAELVVQMLMDMGAPIDKDIATCLYTGILTDTGSFQYANSTSDTMRLAADLLDKGVDKTRIAQEVYETAPFGFLALAGRVLSRAQLFKEERLVYSLITHEDLRVTDVVIEETDGLMDLLRSTRDADVAILFKEQSDGVFKASLRSKGRVSVGEIARARGGGGHELASGFTTKDVEGSIKGILEEIGT
jgi:phosphoesterase RecJ-like protein